MLHQALNLLPPIKYLLCLRLDACQNLLALAQHILLQLLGIFDLLGGQVSFKALDPLPQVFQQGLALLLRLLTPEATLLAQGDEMCLMCHGDAAMLQGVPGAQRLLVTARTLAGSAHGEAGVGCTLCHQNVPLPHAAADVPPVDCGFCHSTESGLHAQSLHGQAAARRAPRAPSRAARPPPTGFPPDSALYSSRAPAEARGGCCGMCGIVGYIGPKDPVEVLVEGLRRLEYRGYDSAGIAVVDEAGNVAIRRAPGKLRDLEKAIAERPLKGVYGIGHTRWATHGRPTEENAHPHRDCTGRLVVIHNGIIENYLELKHELQASGVRFASDTDTEIVAHLVESCYRGDLAAAVGEAAKQLEGSFAVVLLARDEPDVIVAARRHSPLVVGLGDGESFLASDVTNSWSAGTRPPPLPTSATGT